jgi:hypothetical protein
MKFSAGQWITGALSVIGAINWGLVGLFDFNLVHTLFGWARPVERSIYVAVGLSAILFGISVASSPEARPRMIERIKERKPTGVV